MSDFADQLASLLGREAARARKSPELYGEMIERLASSLGLTVAMASKGDPAKIDDLLTGIEAHVHAEAVANAPLAKLVAQAVRP